MRWYLSYLQELGKLIQAERLIQQALQEKLFVSRREKLLFHVKSLSDHTQEHNSPCAAQSTCLGSLLSAPFFQGTFALLSLSFSKLFTSRTIDCTSSAWLRVYFWLSPKEGTFWGSSNLKFSPSHAAKHPSISAFRGHISDKGLSSNTSTKACHS